MSINQDNDSYRDMRSLLEGVNEELGKKTDNLKEASKAYSSLTSTVSKLALQEEDITRYSDKQLDNYNAKSKAAIAEIQKRAKLLEMDKFRSVLGEDLLTISDKEFQAGVDLLKQDKLITDAELSLIRGKRDGFKLEQEIVDKIDDQVKKRKESNKAMGISGALLKGLTDLSPELAKGLKIDQITTDMQDFSDKSVEAGNKVSRLQTLGVGLQSAFKNLGETLTDPAIIGAAIVKGFLKVEEAQKDFRNQTGQTIDHFDTLNMSLLTSAEYIKSAVGLSKQLGVNAAVVFSESTITEVGELTEHMGLGAKEAANLAKFAKLSGKELSTVTDNTFKATSEFIKTNKVGISVKDVFNDIGGVSDSISLSLGGHPGKIRDAALAARELGVSLDQVDKISDSLLNFQSSIESELAAELLTGKQLNLEKAREYALMNDMKGVANELVKNQSIMQAFASNNRVEQNAVAKAMGMSRDEMSKMIFHQQIQNGLSTEQARKAAHIGEEEAKRLTVTKQISNAVDNVTQAFGGALSYFTPLLSNATALKVIFVAIGGIYLTKMMMSIAATTVSIIAQTAANVGLASSQTVVATTSGGMGAGLIAGGKALGSFGKSAISAVPILLAIGAAAVGIGFGLNLATPAIIAIGGVIGTVFKGIVNVIKGVSGGLVDMFNVVSGDNILPILLLGPALFGIASGLSAMGLAGLLAMPTLLALTAVGSVSEGLGSIFGGDEENTSSSKNNEMSGIEKKLDKLISVVEQGGVVMLDSNRVGEFLPKMLALNESKVGG